MSTLTRLARSTCTSHVDNVDAATVASLMATTLGSKPGTCGPKLESEEDDEAEMDDDEVEMEDASCREDGRGVVDDADAEV